MLGAGLAATGIALGAFGAHALRSMATRESIDIFDTGVRYQMYHAFGLIASGLIGQGRGNSDVWTRRSIFLFSAGTALFSGSLYVLALTGVSWLGYLTPFGGLAFIGGWISLFLAARG